MLEAFYADKTIAVAISLSSGYKICVKKRDCCTTSWRMTQILSL